MDKLDLILESIERDMDEAVVSPVLRRKYVDPQQKEIPKVTSSKLAAMVPDDDEGDEDEVAAKKRRKHIDSPLSDAKMKQIEKAKENKEKSLIPVNVYGVTEQRGAVADDYEEGIDGDSITPDHLFSAGGGWGATINTALTFIRFPDRSWAMSGEDEVDSIMDLDGMPARTHDILLSRLIDQDSKYQVYRDDTEYITNKVILGRWYEGILSFWNGLNEDAARSLAKQLISKSSMVTKVNEIWVASMSEYERG